MNQVYIFALCLFILPDSFCQNRKPNPAPNPLFSDCSKCRAESCAQPDQVCRAGLVKDVCDCCTVCARAQAEQCDMEVANDARRAFEKPFYTPSKGRCGANLVCSLQFDQETNTVTSDAICTCKSDKAVCGEDGKTYKNRCSFEETMAGRSERFRIVRDEPCDEAPTILSAPTSGQEKVGDDVLLSCEVAGYPTPKIEWTYTNMERQNFIVLPSDHTSKSVQVRGGPDHYQVTGWLQMSNLQRDDTGVYTCVAKNKLGKAVSELTLTVTPTGREL